MKKVTLVGAGPGGRGLLTLRGAERLAAADVVLYDHLVSADIISLIPPDAEKIDVGKHVGNHPVPQEEINRLLLEKAQSGLEVVRLKGGDPFVFGRGGEELELLAEYGVTFEVVPGVTSAIAGLAFAGIPVTHREYASSLHIITGHAKNGSEPNINYDALVRSGGTLVFMMSVAAIGAICEGCVDAGMSREMPAVIIENAADNAQRKFVGTVGSLPELASANSVQSPAIVAIGEVCRLSERFDWFGCRPLFGRRTIVARSKPGLSKLTEKLRELGCDVTEVAPPRIERIEGSLPDSFDGYAWLVFTSAIGVNIFFDMLIERSIDIRSLHRLKTACVGSETERELAGRGLFADYRPSEFSGTAFANGLAKRVGDGEHLLIARAKDGADELTSILTKNGITFDDIAVYEKVQTAPKTKADANRFDFAAFTSSSAVETFAASFENYGSLTAVCIGERTAATAKSLGMKVHISAEAAIDSMLKKIEEMFA